MAIPVVSKLGKKIFGTRNDRMVKRYLRIVDQVTALDDSMRALTDPELRAKTDEFRTRLEDGEHTEQLIPEVFAVAREAMDRSVAEMRHSAAHNLQRQGLYPMQLYFGLCARDLLI